MTPLEHPGQREADRHGWPVWIARSPMPGRYFVCVRHVHTVRSATETYPLHRAVDVAREFRRQWDEVLAR